MELLFLAATFGAGLIVGWWFLPEPAFVRRWHERLGLARKT